MQLEQSRPLSVHAIWDTWMFVLLFFVIWVIRSLTYPALDCLMDCERHQALLILGWKTIVWFLMPVVYLWRVDQVNPFEYLRLKSNVKTNMYCMLGLITLGSIWITPSPMSMTS